METERLCGTCLREQIWDYLTGDRVPGAIKDFLVNIRARQNWAFCKLLYGILAVNFIPFDSNSLHGTVCQLEKLPGTASWLNVYPGDGFGMRIRVEKRPLIEDATGSTYLVTPVALK
jgi:hypothetical protein